METPADTALPAPDWRAIVGDLVDTARRSAGNGEALAQQLERLGVTGERGRYSMSAISNWVKGRTMPPADVLLAVAVVSGQSLDTKLGEHASVNGNQEVDGLKAEVARLQAEMMHLYSRVGEPYERSDSGEPPGAARTGTDGP
jgi:transcriptional regulator with XRE-family HTH domain